MTDLEACNKALMLLGVAPIGALSDATQPARVISRLLGPAKQAVLSDFMWSFALRMQGLPAVSVALPSGYSYAYTYPDEAVNLYAVYGTQMTNIKIPFVRAGRYIYTRQEIGAARYTFNETDLSRWSEGAVEALVTRLASDAAVALASNPQLSLALLEKYRMLLAEVRQNSLHEEYTDPFITPGFPMTDAEREVVNKALFLAGVRPVGNLNDEAQANKTLLSDIAQIGRIASGLLPLAEKAVLADFAWSFAVRLQAISSASTTLPPGYSYAYAYPANAVNVYAIYGTTPDIKIPYMRAGSYVYTRQAATSMKYTMEVTDLALWSNDAIEALINRLASDAATVLAGSPELSSALMQKYLALIETAKQNSLHEEYTDPYFSPLITDADDKAVVNKAMFLAGIRPVGNLNDEAKANKVLLADISQAGRIMSELLPTAKRATLADFHWSFAQRLQAISSAGVAAPPGYSYAYAYPANAVNIYAIYGSTPDIKIPYLRSGLYVYTRQAAVSIKYTAEEMALSAWSNDAIEALTNRLASDAATVLAGSPELSAALMQKYMALIETAKQNSLNEEYSDPYGSSLITNAKDREVVNKAIALAGVRPVGNLNEEAKAGAALLTDISQVGRIMSELLPTAKRAVLSDFAWSFALKVQAPSPAAAPALPGYTNSYAYPSSAVNVLAVYGSTPDIKAQFVRLGQFLYTKQPVSTVKFTEEITNLDLWSNDAIEALINRLASDAATVLAGSPEISAALMQKYMVLIETAKQNSLHEEYTDPYGSSFISDARDRAVVNKAIVLTGIKPVGNLNEEAKEGKALLTDISQVGRIVSDLLPSAKRAVLSDFAWSFAVRRIEPSEAAGSPAPGYSHVYVCPDDAVNLHGVYGSSQELKCQFVRIGDGIQTKEPATAIFYTAEVTDLSKWSNEAVEALTNRLASDAVTALTGDSRLSITLLEKYRLLLNIAKGNSATEEYGPRVRPTHYIDVRRR